MEFLNYHQIAARRDKIRTSFEELMANPYLVVRPGSLQWIFFRACMDTLLERDHETVLFADLTPAGAAQYKFEVERKLNQFYLNPGKMQNYVFSLCHLRNISFYGLRSYHYPCFRGYCVLVREASNNTHPAFEDRLQLLEYLEKIVAEGIAAEFGVYKSLPAVDFSALPEFFEQDGPALKEIVTIGEGLKKRGWNISNEMNPSTYRIIQISTKNLGRDEAEIKTTEYWYLRWWDHYKNKYTYTYRESNKQLYVLRPCMEKWKIYQNIKPKPKSSQPLRWKRAS